MVAVLLLSIALLGVGGMLLLTLKNSQSSMERTQAVIRAHSMLDLLRANKSNAIIGRYNLTSWTCDPPSSDNDIGSAQALWLASLKDELGAAACGRISCNSLTCDVSVQWDDSRGQAGNVAEEYTVRTRL